MTAFTAREVRAWALAHDVECPRTGKIARHVIDAYLLDVHGVTPGTEPEPQPAAAEDPEPAFTIDVTIAGHDDAAAEIAQQLVNAIWRAFEAGRAAERADIVAALGMSA